MRGDGRKGEEGKREEKWGGKEREEEKQEERKE